MSWSLTCRQRRASARADASGGDIFGKKKRWLGLKIQRRDSESLVMLGKDCGLDCPGLFRFRQDDDATTKTGADAQRVAMMVILVISYVVTASIDPFPP